MITSGTALRLPLKRLIALCRKYSVPVFVDGAHAIGNVPVDLQDLAPDFFVTNCHKHLCTPKGVAILYVDEKYTHQIHPLSTSHSWLFGFWSEFSWTGTQDWSAYLSVVSAIRFFVSHDINTIMKRNQQLAREAGLYLARLWQTRMFVSSENLLANMALVQLPSTNREENAVSAKKCHDILWKEFKIEAIFLHKMLSHLD